jgi:PAS domain S-box-containing protein
VDDALELIESRDRRIADDVLLEARRARRRVAVLLIARWLATERRSEPEELAWIDELGEYSALHGSGLESSMDGYFAWRDATIAIIREEAARGGVPAASRDQAVEMVRRSCDATVKRMAGSFDAHRLKEAILLEESDRQIRTIFATMPCGGCLVGPDNRILLANQAAAELLQVPLERLQGAHTRVVTKEMRNADGSPLSTPLSELVRRSGTAQAAQLRFAGDAGETTWLQVHAAPILDGDGSVTAVLVVFVDVSGVHEAAEARRESEAKSRFLATMSHELRTPLNSILGFAQLLARDTSGLNERQHRYVGNIVAGGNTLLALVNDVLDLARARSGELSVDVRPVEVAEVTAAVSERMTPLANEKGVRLTTAVDPCLAVLADAKRLEQVLLNLLANSVRFTDRGRISITARQAGERVEIRVSDTGFGIPADQVDRVFQEFVQVDTGPSRRYDGSGLGLPIANRLAQLMGGTLTLTSRVGRGTTVALSLPRA